MKPLISFSYLQIIILIKNTEMKKSLAFPRTVKSAQHRFGLSPNKLLITPTQFQNQHNQRQALLQNNEDPNFLQRHNDKNLRIMPTSMLAAIYDVLIMDISFNKLSNQSIQVVMNSCTKLVTLCIQGNFSSIIPASISKLKDLKNFRHDWLTIESKNAYEPEERLQLIKNSAIKPQYVTKMNKLVGIDFQIYCRKILKIQMDKILLIKIQQCDTTPFAKKNMLKYMTNLNGQKKKNFQTMATKQQQDPVMPDCFDIYRSPAKELRKKIQKVINVNPIRNKGEDEDSEGINNIKIKNIRDIPESQYHSIAFEMSSQNIEPYSFPGMLLHQILSSFDKNSRAAADIDALLLKGFNPNQYDQNGFSPYHICVIYKQIKGLQYILQVSQKNPGFLDLEMPSVKDYRNILHLCVFLKNYKFTKMLIQFGFPQYKRDFSGSRIHHLVDQNLEFLLLLRKMLKKKTRDIVSPAYLARIHQNRILYVRQHERQKQESKVRISQSINNDALENYERAVRFHK